MLKAIHNNVVLQKESSTMNKGIYMPHVENDAYVVLGIGEEVSTVKVGQKVIIKEQPKKVILGLDEYYICPIENIIAIWEDENE